MPTRVRVELGARSYTVLVGQTLLDSAGSEIAQVLDQRRACIISDSTVGPLYRKRLESSLTDAGMASDYLEFPAGESSKSMAEAERLCDGLIAARHDRHSFIIALGGGVVGDLAGFVSAIFTRGIPFVQIPTTILAQVDSAVGGKTGVNAAAGKNLLGCFHQPALVLADTGTLDTLPDREFRAGFAEIIKHAIIRDPAMLDLVSPLRRDCLEEILATNIRIKATIVSADEHETTGLRALLNFGHTIGHGIENAAGYGRLLHGEAISLGIVAASRLSVELAGMPQSDNDRIVTALRAYELPVRLPDDIPTTAILDALRADKKFQSGAIRFVLSPRIGEAFVSSDVTQTAIQQAVEALR